MEAVSGSKAPKFVVGEASAALAIHNMNSWTAGWKASHTAKRRTEFAGRPVGLALEW